MWRNEWDSVLQENYGRNTGITGRALAERFGVSFGMLQRRAKKLGLTQSNEVERPQRANKLRNAPLPPAKIQDGPRLYTGVVPVLPFNDPPKPAKRTLPPPPPTPGPYSPFKTCQWINGEVGDDHTMCGAKTVPGYSWCAEHKARCLVRVVDARAKRDAA